MPYWANKPKTQVKTESVKMGDGENTYLPPFEIALSESSESRNTSSRVTSALSVCPGRADAFAAITTSNGLGQRNNQYPHVLDGTAWKRWDGAAWQNVSTGLTNARAKFVELNTEASRFTVFVNGTEKIAWDGTSTTSLTQAPATRLYTVDDYRLYALIGSVLKCSAEGSVTDWTTANDADSIAVTGMIGPGTAIAAYNDTVICWSEQSMHVLYGNDPYDFSFSDPIDTGCIADRSVIIHGGKLYFLDFGQFMVYTGGKPVDISQKVKKYLDGINSTYKGLCSAGKHGRYVYLSIPYGAVTTNNMTLEYDTQTGNWYVKDVGYLDFVNIGEYLYGIDSTGKIHNINSGTSNNGTAISWYHITGVLNFNTASKLKTVSNIWLIIDLPTTSTLTVSYSTTVDGNDFATLYTFTGNANEQRVRVKVPTNVLQSVKWFRLKFAGTGPCTIHCMELDLRVRGR